MCSSDLVSGLEMHVSGLDTHVSELEMHVSGLDTHVSELEMHVSGLDTHVSGLEMHVSEPGTHVSGTEFSCRSMGDGHFGGEILDGVGVNRLIIRDQRVNPRAGTPFSGEAQI